MTDQIQVSNALTILSYFSSLLDPISTSPTSQRQPNEKILSKPLDDIIESPNLPPSSNSSSSTETSSVALNLSNFSTCSIAENFQPIVIGLKLPLSLSCTSEYSATPSNSPSLLTSTTLDHQTFFLINQFLSPGNSNEKVVSMGPSVSQSMSDDMSQHQTIFTESSWSLRSSPCSPDSPANIQKQSLDAVKSEHFFIANGNSDKNMSISGELPWKEGQGDLALQLSEPSLSFSIPFLTTTATDNKRHLNGESQQSTMNECNVTSFNLHVKSSNAIQPSNSNLSGGVALSHLQSVGGNCASVGREEKVCAVCGDRALGCNFDAVSCESCKAFFRRNAFKEEKIKCLFSGNCLINVNTRRFCSHCRLKRCFAVGMKKDLILGVDEKKRRMEVVKQNRKRRSEESVSSTTTIANPTMTPTSQHTATAEIPHNESTNLLTLAKLDPLMSTSSAFSLMSQSIDSQLVRKLTAEESHMLIDLNQVYDLSFTVDLEPLIHITQLNPSLNQLVNQSSYTVLRLIKFAKRLEDFVKLSQDLQIGILKGCWFHLLLLRPVSLFDAERDGWITPKGVIPTDILKNATGYVELHDDHVRYCRSIKSIIGNDIMLLVILLVLVLFAPDGPHVVSREVISNIQDRYVILLKHYLEAKYTFKRSAHMFPQLLEKIRELNSLVENHAKILMDINPQEIEPIMLEMLDFKN